MLAKDTAAAATHNQALSALLFLYREGLGMDLPWLDGVQRPRTPKRIPSVLTVAEGLLCYRRCRPIWPCWPACCAVPACG